MQGCAGTLRIVSTNVCVLPTSSAQQLETLHKLDIYLGNWCSVNLSGATIFLLSTVDILKILYKNFTIC